MKTIKRTATFNAPPEKVFSSLDDLGVTGMHMTSSSAMMMGSRLRLEYLTGQHQGLGTKYRWTGSMMGLKVGSSRVDLQACKLEYSIVSPK